MSVALYLLLAIVIVGAVLKLTDRPADSPTPSVDNEPPHPRHGDICCGQHTTCERDSLLTAMSDKIEYFDDEELDVFAGRHPDSYTHDESEAFRDVLLTLRPDEIAAWGRSMQLRGIELPDDVRDEFLLMVSEARQSVLQPQTTI